MAILERLAEMQNAHGKNRLVMILDGMGVAVMRRLLDKNGYFCRHLAGVETAIIPATTVAATTRLSLAGLANGEIYSECKSYSSESKGIK